MTKIENRTSGLYFDQSDEDIEEKKSDFLSKWCELFPGAKIPIINFYNNAEVKQRLIECRYLIKELEERLNQEKFYLLFLQVLMSFG